jgi:hypothetical protein
MTNFDTKSAPTGIPDTEEKASDSEDRFRKAVDEDEDLRVRLHISGGLRSEEYELDLEASVRGTMSCKLHCNLSRRSQDQTQLQIDPKFVKEVVERLNRDQQSRSSPRQGGFPPDSLIGRLEIVAGGQTFTTYFMADPEQARMAGQVPSDQMLSAVEMLYSEAERRLGIDSVRP